ncbi:hypothetical protein Tco_0844851 [Tanacetum coccineum]
MTVTMVVLSEGSEPDDLYTSNIIDEERDESGVGEERARVVVKTVNGEVQLHTLVDGKKIIINESTVRRDLQLDDVEDEAVHKEFDDSLVKAATTASTFEAEQDSGNITKTRSKVTPNEAGFQGTTSGDGPRRQETMGDTIAQTRFENVSRLSNDPLLARVGMSRRVESSRDEDDLGEDASKQGRRISAIDAYEDITLVNVQYDAEMFDVNTLTSDEVFAEQEVTAKDVNLTIDEVTLAQALAALKSVKPKVKGVVIQEPSTTTTTTTISSQQSSQDKGKGIMVEEPMKTMKNKDLIRLDEETAKRLHK